MSHNSLSSTHSSSAPESTLNSTSFPIGQPITDGAFRSKDLYKNYNEQERALILMAMAAARERLRNKMRNSPDDVRHHGELDPLRDSISRELYRTFCDILKESEYRHRLLRIPSQNCVRLIWNKFLDKGIVITKRAGVGGRKKKGLEGDSNS